MLNNKHLIFVYGTLKKDGGNGAHSRYLHGATYRGACSVPGVMLHLGYYPGMVEDKVCRVTGEVYEVDAKAIQGMDGYEGVPHNYVRRLVDTPWGKAWCYFKNHVTLPLAKNMVCVARGLWTGGQGDKTTYSEVVDFYKNKRYLEPKYRAMEKQPIISNTPESGAVGKWSDELKCFIFPDGSMHTLPGVSAAHSPGKVLPFPTQTKDEPPTSTPERAVRGVEMML